MYSHSPIMVCLLVLSGVLVVGTAPGQAVEGQYIDVLIPAKEYEGYILWSWLSFDDGEEIDIKITLRSGPECRIWIIRDILTNETAPDVKVNRTLTHAKDTADFTFVIPDDSWYTLYIFNDHDTRDIYVDVEYTDSSREEASEVLESASWLCFAWIMFIAIFILVIIVVVIVAVTGTNKKPPQGVYPPQPPPGYYPYGGYMQPYGGYMPPPGGYPPQPPGCYPPPRRQS